MTKQEWLERYDALEKRREDLQRLYEEAEEHGNYYTADEESADVNEVLAELADYAAELIRGDVERQLKLQAMVDRGEFA